MAALTSLAKVRGRLAAVPQCIHATGSVLHLVLLFAQFKRYMPLPSKAAVWEVYEQRC